SGSAGGSPESHRRPKGREGSPSDDPSREQECRPIACLDRAGFERAALSEMGLHPRADIGEADAIASAVAAPSAAAAARRFPAAVILDDQLDPTAFLLGRDP